MAYKTEDLKERAIEAIQKNNLFFLADVYAYLGISHSAFFDHFPKDSENYEYIKELIDKNRAKTKVSIRSKLHSSQAPAALLGLYKLLATDEERRALSMEYTEHSGELKVSKIEVELVKSPHTDK